MGGPGEVLAEREPLLGPWLLASGPGGQPLGGGLAHPEQQVPAELARVAVLDVVGVGVDRAEGVLGAEGPAGLPVTDARPLVEEARVDAVGARAGRAVRAAGPGWLLLGLPQGLVLVARRRPRTHVRLAQLLGLAVAALVRELLLEGVAPVVLGVRRNCRVIGGS